MLKDVKYSIYYAGHIFDFKHLTGNYELSKIISKTSKQKFRCILPQDLEQTDSRSVAIRDNDLYTLARCDLALFHFDGTEVDSGTVVEFIVAKMLNIPSVVIRTDFRQGGDQGKDGDPWNLMMSGYPYTKTLAHHSMALYQEHGSRGMQFIIAQSIINEFESLLLEIRQAHLESKEVRSQMVAETVSQYLTILGRCGDSLTDLFKGGEKELQDLICSKFDKLCIPPITL